MTKQQFDDLYLGKAVHCDTEEKANEFLKLAHGVGYKWITHKCLLDNNHWSEYKSKTYYNVNDYGFSYAGVDMYKRSGFTIVKFELEPVETFNVGDVVYDKYGNKGEVNELSYLVLFEHKRETCYANELTKTKPLQKITRKELAEKGYELED